MNSSGRTVTVVSSMLGLLLAPFGATAAAGSTTVEPPADFGGDLTTNAGVESGTVSLDAGITVPGTPGGDGSVETAGDAEPAPEGVWITVSAMLFAADPPCVRTTSQFLEDVTQGEADVIRLALENQFVAEYETYISSGNEPPPPCPTPDGTPGLDPTPAQAFADDAAAILPHAEPTISGGYAITGLRSWIDLGRDPTFTTTRDLDLGPFTRTATFTATATATIDWGDGITTTHTSRGGSYHDGEPGPTDIAHTYRDATPEITLTVTDTWHITVTVPGLDDITLTYTADPAPLTYPVREVRSTRDN